MAGTYADVPGPRMAYDRDGSVGFTFTSGVGVVSTLSTAQLQALNDEDNDQYQTAVAGVDGGSCYVGVIFPELRDIAGWHVNATMNSTGGTLTAVQTSPDTTNGIDGTWTTRQTYGANNLASAAPFYRSGITTGAVAGIKGIRVYGTNAPLENAAFILRSFHLFGTPSATVTRLALWHPTLDQELTGAYFDWGDVPRSTTASTTFRVKNLSSTLTASSIGLSIETLTNTTPSVPGQHSFSDDGVNFASTLNIGSLAPGDISSVITFKRTTPADAVLSVWAARIVALPGGWA